MTDQTGNGNSTRQFRKTLARVMTMQLFALLILALLQLRYNS